MKKSNFLVVFVLVALCALGWLSIIFGATSDTISYYKYVKEGDKLVEKGLYQRAISSYDLALKENETKTVYQKINTAYKKRYKEAPDETFNDYKSFLKKAIAKYPGDEKIVDSTVEIYRIEGNYKEMYNCLKKAISNGYNTSKIKEKLLETRYSYELKSTGFAGIGLTPNTRYTVKRSEGYNIYDIKEGYILSQQHTFASIMSEDGVFITTDSDSRLVNIDGKVLGIFSEKVTNAGVYSEGLVPACCKDNYSYYDEFAEKQFGDYQMAGMFQEGFAAVKKDGKWMIIDKKGNVKSEQFDEIVLDGMGRYVVGGIVIAKADGKYGIYDKKMKKKVELDCTETDLPTEDGIIAVCKGDKWGFVNKSGKTVIKAEFSSARSFSNGLAAVCKDGKWGFINSDGKKVIDYSFSDAGYFNNMGFCPVRTDENTSDASADEGIEEATEENSESKPDKGENKEIKQEKHEIWKLIELVIKED